MPNLVITVLFLSFFSSVKLWTIYRFELSTILRPYAFIYLLQSTVGFQRFGEAIFCKIYLVIFFPLCYLLSYFLLSIFLFISCTLQTRVSIDWQCYAVECNTRHLQEGFVNDFKRYLLWRINSKFRQTGYGSNALFIVSPDLAKKDPRLLTMLIRDFGKTKQF